MGRSRRKSIEWGMEEEEPEVQVAELEPEPAETEETRASKRRYTQAPEVVDPGLPCPHCGERYGHRVARTYNQGQRRMTCAACARPFPARRLEG